jgi:ferritin-like metal-binding protein YciE
MGILFSENLKTLDGLFAHSLKSIYYAERQIVDSLPDMIGMATNPELKAGFQQHLDESRNQVTRLEQVFGMVNIEVEEGSCPAIDGLIKEANATAGEIDDKSVLDAALTFSAQQIEHHEIAVYGTLVAWAKEMGREDVATILAQTLAEERATDEKLTTIAEGRINAAADRTINADLQTV